MRFKTDRNSSVTYLRSLLDAGSEGIVVVRSDGLILDLTDSGARMLGADLDGPPPIGRYLTDVLAPEEAALVAGHCSSAAQQPTPSGPFRWRVRQGEAWRHIEGVIHNKAKDPNIRGLILVMRDIAPERELELRLRNDAFRDTLTGLHNRVGFNDKIRIAIMDRRPEAMVAVLFLDLDDFKAVNDSRGHAVGDELLCEAAERLQASVRPQDAVGRIGGDEFVVLLEDITRPEQAGEIAQRVIAAFRDAFLVKAGALRVQTSVGIALSHTGGETAETLLRDADMAMYAAKARGKGRYEYFDDKLRASATQKLALRQALEQAVSDENFVLHYQPVVALASGELVGAEALLRWRTRNGGLRAPHAFLHLAEEAGLMDIIGRWVLREACAAAQRWQAPDGSPFQMAVNLSARQLDQPGFALEVEEILGDARFPAEGLTVEITEQVFMHESGHVLENLQALRDAGVRIAIDDFGTGYSSLSYLQRFAVDTLKIDKSFIDDVGEGGQVAALVEGIIGIAHTLKLDVVAEGIEHNAQRKRLRDLGCDLGQGYLFAKPLPGSEMVAFLNASRELASKPVELQRQAS
ncbi:MAG: EAL domain-containing protein [Actinomycetota bacterium]|nr:EAL domain-containing protein [Actinomycetota bacterium]